MSHVSHRNEFAQALFHPLPARYDLLEELLSFGQNARWRRTMVDRVVPADPGTVLDVATGTAGVALQLAERTQAAIVGLDLTEPMLRHGQVLVARDGHDHRIRLVAGRAEELPFPDATFDALTFTYLLRYVEDPPATLRELVRVLRPGAPIAALEFHVPPNKLWRTTWWLYTRAALPALGAALGGRAWFDVGRFLGPSISRHYREWPLERQLDDWHRAGIVEVGYRLMSLGGGVVIWGRTSRG